MQKQLIALLVLTSLVFGSWGITRLTNNQPMKARGSLRVSPDKHYIASMGMRSYEPPIMLLLTDINTGNEQTIGYANDCTDLSWSFDSQNFLFSTVRRPVHNTQIRKCNISSGDVCDFIMAKTAKFSPVSNKLAYLSDNTIYIRNMDNNQDVPILTDSTIYALEWAQNSDQFIYLISYYLDGSQDYRIRSINLSDLSIKDIYRSYGTETPMPQNFGLTWNDYQFSSYIKNGEENILIAKANPHNGNTKDSIMIYQTAYDSVRVLLVQPNQPYDCNTGFFSPKWSPNGKAFAVQYGTEIVDYGCNHKVLYYCLSDSSSCFFDNSGGEFVNPVFLDSATIVFTGNFTSTIGDLQVDICRADCSLGISTENKPTGIYLNNYPNPFNNSTVINYAMPTANSINLAIYNAKGEMVKNLYTGHQSAGRHASTFNASGLNSGVYFVKLISKNHTEIRKIMLIK